MLPNSIRGVEVPDVQGVIIPGTSCVIAFLPANNCFRITTFLMVQFILKKNVFEGEIGRQNPLRIKVLSLSEKGIIIGIILLRGKFKIPKCYIKYTCIFQISPVVRLRLRPLSDLQRVSVLLLQLDLEALLRQVKFAHLLNFFL